MLVKLLKDIFSSGHSIGAKKAAITNGHVNFKLPTYQRGAAIIVIHSGSEGDAHKSFVEDQMRAILPYTSGIREIDVRNSSWLEQLNRFLEEPIWFVFSYFGVGQDISIEYQGRQFNLWEAARIPFIRPYGDIPAYFPLAHRQAYRNLINAYGSQEHSEFLHKWFTPRGMTYVFPPILFSPLSENEINFSAKRNGKIIFPKNGNDPDALIKYWRINLPPFVARALESVAESITSKNVIDQPICIDDWLLQYFSSVSTDISGSKHLLFFLVAQLDDYVRRVKSTMIVRSLLDLPIEVRGTKWQHINFSGTKAEYINDASVSSTQELIKTSLAIVDMSPNTHLRPHDRVLRAASRYTTFFTNTQTYYQENFERHEEFCFQYSPESIREHVENALLHPDETVELGRYQGHKMRMFALDEDYATTLLTAVDTCVLSLSERPSDTQDFVHFVPFGE